MNDREAIWIGEWHLDSRVRTLSRGESETRIEPKMLDVLLLLADRAGQPVPREEIERTVWSGAAVGTEILNRTVWKLRKALGDDPADPRYIETIPRVGYRLVASVRPDAAVGRGPQPPGRPGGAGIGVWATAVVVAALLIVMVTLRPGGTPVPSTISPTRIVPLTATPGYEASPALSPDGRHVAFQRFDTSLEGPTWDITVMDLETRTSTTLAGSTDAHEYGPAFSPGGDSLVFVRQTAVACEIVVAAVEAGDRPGAVVDEDGTPVATIDADGRTVAPCSTDQGHDVAWGPDGSFVHAATGGGHTVGLQRLWPDGRPAETLTTPPVGFDGDRSPRVSPDGARIAFVRQRTQGIGDVYLTPIDGSTDPVRLTFDNRAIGGLAWASDGSGVVFSSNRGGNSQLWLVGTDGSGPVPWPMTGRNASHVAVTDSVTVYEEYFGDSDIWALDPIGGTASAWGGSSRSEWAATVSPDGASIAFISDQTGAPEIWVAPLGGGRPTRITDLRGAPVDPPRWSPDGSALIFAAAPEGNFDVFTLDATGGMPSRITSGEDDERVPAWWNGQVVYAANHTGSFELWVVPAEGGPAARLTSGGGWGAQADPLTGALYFTRADEPGLWRLDDENGRAVQVWSDLHPADWANWTPTGVGVLYFRLFGTETPRIEQYLPDTGDVQVLFEIDTEAPDQAGVSAGPDGTVYFTRVVRSESDLWIASMSGER